MITTKFTGYVKRVDDEDVNIPVTVTLTYDWANDPFAVQAIFAVSEEEDRVWIFARDLLLQGVVSPVPVGQGDVKFRYFGPATHCLLMCLRSDEGHADVALPQPLVAAFLEKTKEQADQEDSKFVGEQVDDFLKELFEGA